MKEQKQQGGGQVVDLYLDSNLSQQIHQASLEVSKKHKIAESLAQTFLKYALIILKDKSYKEEEKTKLVKKLLETSLASHSIFVEPEKLDYLTVDLLDKVKEINASNFFIKGIGFLAFGTIVAAITSTFSSYNMERYFTYDYYYIAQYNKEIVLRQMNKERDSYIFLSAMLIAGNIALRLLANYNSSQIKERITQASGLDETDQFSTLLPKPPETQTFEPVKNQTPEPILASTLPANEVATKYQPNSYKV